MRPFGMGVSKVGIALLSALLGASAFSQSTLDLSKDPRLQQLVDVHLKRALLPEFAKYLKAHSNQKFAIDRAIESLMVCVLVEKQPLWKVMTGVAEVMGCDWVDLRSEWKLVSNKDFLANIHKYPNLERIVLQNDIFEKAKDLADYTSKNRWHVPSMGASPPFEIEDETNAQWATRVMSEPAYYVAGIMFRDSPVLAMAQHQGNARKDDCDDNFTTTAWPQAYRLIAPPSPEIAELNQCEYPQDISPDLSGAHVVLRSLPWAGTLQAVLIDQAGSRATKPKHLVRYPKPVGDLAKSKPGRWILEWESQLKNLSEPWLDNSVKEFSLSDSPFYRKQHGLEECLEGLFSVTHQSIICDAFRIPTTRKEPPKKADSVRNWLNALRETQRCFVKIDNGTILVRHGGFWDLREMQADELSIRNLEQVRNPDFIDYANFAIANRTPVLGAMPPFFETQDIPLTTFNPTPLRESYAILMAFGQMDGVERVMVLNGGAFNTIKPIIGTRSYKQENQYFLDQKKRTVKIDTSHFEEPMISGWVGEDYYLHASAAYGPFYEGHAIGFGKRLLEDYRLPAHYLQLWGASPYDIPGFVEKYGAGFQAQAHYLMLRSTSPGYVAPSEEHRGRLYGKFEFLSGISDQDGVVNIVQIPEPTKE